VADSISRQLLVTRAKPQAALQASPADYKKNEVLRDGQVPDRFKKLTFGQFIVPKDQAEWTRQRPDVSQKVTAALGDLPPRPSPLQVRRITREFRNGYTLEKVAIDNGVDGEVTALLLVPDGLTKPAPAILWLHSSTPDKTQIIVPHTNGGTDPLGEVFTKAGYVVLAPDAYWHGDRELTGPAGAAEPYRAQQDTLFKLNLLQGRTLWGMFVRDDRIALDYLCSRPEVDRKRIGATGISMGSTRSYWLAATDDRIACAVGVACLTRCENLIKHGQLRQHGTYFFTIGLLKHFDTEAVISLIAPRPYLALTGDLDAGSPADGIKVIEEKAGAVYKVLGASDRFKSILYPDVGHTYTPQMRAEMLAWFARWLK
jgi:dienelactone hydrolase